MTLQYRFSATNDVFLYLFWEQSTNLTKDVQELKKAVADLLNVLSPTKQSFKFVPRSCREIYMEFPFSSSGKYIIDPDGPKGDPSISVYCNMESGGNQTLCNVSM